MSAPSILIVDDEVAVCWSLRRAFEREGHYVEVAASAEAGLEIAQRIVPNIIILDIRLPGMDGLTALSQFQTLAPQAGIIIITAHGNLSTAVRAVEGGAFDYLAKPFDLSTVMEVVRRALHRGRESEPAPTSSAPDNSEEIIGHAPVMQAIFKRIALVAPHDACVMITGESGTGKELVARAIHRHSARRAQPFLPVHVAALNPSLVESELFGHVKGAFTGANQARPGLLALAHGGTVFLDELADIPLPVQAKLLRVLERQEILPVGGNVSQSIDVRILSATHADLISAVGTGTFREDLYFRLNVFGLRLPALRERLDDISILTSHFLKRFDPRLLPISQEVIHYLQNQPWRGNVRELRNACEHAAIIARGNPLLPEHFPPPIGGNSSNINRDHLAELVREWVRSRIELPDGVEPTNLYEQFLDDVEPALLDEVLKCLNGNRLAASRRLGLARATLRKLLRKHFATDDPVDEE